ncbi:patatin-like phospholipase family protein [Skermania sp. ID1734]|uniref:patatin-like phospholipase family protein n=1 Tax=Skermania sp. ID1734 TaxID=2597516 RepID=UPI00117E9374|nr:patatin-like phospholipase family protein [Skermania sp. ID1734]TSD97391.1 patatin-like phospholipase family protein [Skermania sp. ID1734]
MTAADRPPRRGLVLGCGGTLGAAWTVAALLAVRDALNWDPRTADVIVGTSAGAELATMLGSGISVDELLAMQRGTTTNPILRDHIAAAPGRFPPLPQLRLGSPRLAIKGLGTRFASGLLPVGNGDPAWMQRLAGRLTSGNQWVSHPKTWLVAMDYDSGERVAFGKPGAPVTTIGAALRASWAIPGWFPPVTIEGRRYIDGGAYSTASADLVVDEGLDELVVLAPMASTGKIPGQGVHLLERLVFRNQMSAGLDAEIEKVLAAGTKVLRIDASAADLDVMGPNFMDGGRRIRTLDHSLESTKEAVGLALAGGALG